jgi:hypothetical protein
MTRREKKKQELETEANEILCIWRSTRYPGRISPCATIYGRIRLQYVSLFRLTLEVSEYKQ